MHNDAIEWLRTFADGELLGDVFTSIPDISELDSIFGAATNANVAAYKEWFEQAVCLILSKAPKCAIFLQSDVRFLNADDEVVQFIDKSHIINMAAERMGFVLLWHKICDRSNAECEYPCSHKVFYSHLLCVCRQPFAKYPTRQWVTPDIFWRGEMVWSRAIGIHSALVGVTFLKYMMQTKVIVDPFCGTGTVLAMANALNIASIGCELSKKRCRKAVKLDLRRALLEMRPATRRLYGLKDDLTFTEEDLPPKPVEHNTKYFPKGEIRINNVMYEHCDDV